MTYNVLSEKLLLANAYLYSGCAACVLPWQYRFGIILAEIERHAPDVLCLQEVDQVRWLETQSALRGLGFDGFYSARTGEKPDGCALFWYGSVLAGRSPCTIRVIMHSTAVSSAGR
jgi:mRNA deadenylase 3'-5' endonuclease subunit Ccr4